MLASLNNLGLLVSSDSSHRSEAEQLFQVALAINTLIFCNVLNKLDKQPDSFSAMA
jgi:hypothetical protein